MGEALLQRGAKRDHSNEHQAEHPQSVLQVSRKFRSLGGDEPLPPGALELFEEKLCKEKLQEPLGSLDQRPVGRSVPARPYTQDSDESEKKESGSSEEKESGSSEERYDTDPVDTHPSKSSSDDVSEEPSGDAHPFQRRSKSSSETSTSARKGDASEDPSPPPQAWIDASQGIESTNTFDRTFIDVWDAHTPAITEGFDDEGFKKVVEQKDENEIKVYIRRVVSTCSMKVIDEGGLNGLVGWFGDAEEEGDTLHFSDLKKALFKALIGSSKDHWVAVKNVTGITSLTAPLDLVGYSQVRSLRSPKQMVKFVTRMVENMGVRITNMGGFSGMMKFYSEPDDMESFQKLMSEIKRAAYEHSWCELD